MALVVYHLSWVDKTPAAKCDFRYVSYWRGNVSSLYNNVPGHESSDFDACQKRWLSFLASARSWKKTFQLEWKRSPSRLEQLLALARRRSQRWKSVMASIIVAKLKTLTILETTESLDRLMSMRVLFCQHADRFKKQGEKIMTVSRLGLTQLQTGLLNLNWRKTSMVWLTAGSWSGCE